MASKVTQTALVLVLLVMLSGGAYAQSDCTRALVALSPCLNFVSGNSSAPSSSCCSQLKDTVQSQPHCLCAVLNGGGSSLGVAINQTLALALPTFCNVQTPPTSQCNAANGPTPSADVPANSPTDSPADSFNETPDILTTPSVPNIPSGTGSKTVPSTNGASAGNYTKVPFSFTAFLLFFASYVLSALRF